MAEFADRCHRQMPADARRTLQDVGLSRAAIENYRIGYGSGAAIGFGTTPRPRPQFADRVVVPILDEQGRVRDIVGEAPAGGRPQFETASGRVDLLFNRAVLQRHTAVVLCESVIDAVILNDHGFPAVAVLGAGSFGPGHAAALADHEVFVCFDNDEVSRRLAVRAAEMMAGGAHGVYVVGLPQGVTRVGGWLAGDTDASVAFGGLLEASRRSARAARFHPDSGLFPAFLEEFSKRHQGRVRGVPTGFPELDRLLGGGLREGLYILAAAPAMGKTTLLRQIADQIAAAGRPALFFSLETSAYELWARSLSRQAGLSTAAIMSGDAEPRQVAAAARDYEPAAQWLSTVEALSSLDPGEIGRRVQRSLADLGQPPVVLIDYLQRLPSPALRLRAEGSPGTVVAAQLRHLARVLSCPIVVAASLSRKACLAGAAVYGELAGFEDAADVVALLRPAACCSTWEEVKRELSREPAVVQLEVTKNRMGGLGTIGLQFYKVCGEFRTQPTGDTV